jgi:hypothetical protein
MVRVALSTAFVASLVLSAFATPIERESFVTIPVKKVGSATAKGLVEKDLRRLDNVNSGGRKASPAATGSGTVTNEDVTYVAAVTVGSQTFSLIVDTGSSNTWVGSGTRYVAGSTGVRCVIPFILYVDVLTPFISTGKSFSVTYGSGSVSGTEYTDTVGLECIHSRFSRTYLRLGLFRRPHRLQAVYWCRQPFFWLHRL